MILRHTPLCCGCGRVMALDWYPVDELCFHDAQCLARRDARLREQRRALERLASRVTAATDAHASRRTRR